MSWRALSGKQEGMPGSRTGENSGPEVVAQSNLQWSHVILPWLRVYPSRRAASSDFSPAHAAATISFLLKHRIGFRTRALLISTRLRAHNQITVRRSL